MPQLGSYLYQLYVAYAAQIASAVVKFVAYAAASMAVSKLLQKKPPGFGDPSLADRTQMVRSPTSARQIIYGETRVSGTLVYISTTGTKNEYLHMVIALAGHEVEGIGDVYFNDELALSDPNYTGSGSAGTGRFTGYAEIYKKLGSDTQTVETNLETATSGLTNGKWTSNHRLRGIAYVYVRLVWNEQVWVGGIPNVSAMVKGKKVYDPRTATTVYSANAALCLRDYLTETRLGMAMDASEMDDTAFTAAANICDEQVQILPASPTTYENRYEANGVLYTSASPDENIGKLLSAMGGLIAYSCGKVVPYAGGYRIPTVTLNEGDFAGAVQIQTKTSARDRVNAVKGVFVSAKSEWQPTDFPPLVSSTYYAEDGNIRYYRDVVLPFTTSSSCAQRLARIELRRARQELTMTARFKLDAMQLRAGDTVMITNAKFGWTNKVFEVMDWHFASDGEPPQLSIEMTLRETASAVYDWSVTDEIEMATTPTTTLPNPFTLAAPTNLSLVADGSTQLVQQDGTAMPRIKVSWSAPAEEFIQSGGTVGIDYKESTSTTYLTWATVPGDRTLEYITSDLKIGLGYNVRIYGLSYFQVATSYVTGVVTVQKDTTPPTAPTDLTAFVGTGQAVSLDWADNTEPDFFTYGVYRNNTGVTPANIATNKIANASGSRFVDTEVTIGTTYYYWVNAVDNLQNYSDFSSPVSAVPTFISGGTVDPTPPATPSAPTFSTETTYISADGTAFARINILAPTMPTGAVALNLLFRMSGASEWMLLTQLDAGSTTVSAEGLAPGITYDFAAQGVSNFGVLSAVSSVLSQLAPKDTTAPATPSGLSATVGTGKAVSLDWADNTESDLSEYGVYRNTTGVTPANANTDKVAEVRASRFVDTDVVLGTTYYYWVNAYDFLENVSGFSTRVSAVPTYIASGDTNPNAPATPNAPTFSSEGTYFASDGTALARITLTAPAMPTGGALLSILFRRSGASEWQIANQISSGSIAVSIDDLTPGQAYEFAARALSTFDVASAVSPTLTRTAPTSSAAPTGVNPATITHFAGNSSSYGANPVFFGKSMAFSARTVWTKPADATIARFEWYLQSGATPVTPAVTAVGTQTAEAEAVHGNSTLQAFYFWVRSIDRIGNKSTWVSDNTNLNTVWGLPAGTMSNQDSTDVRTTGIKTGSGSSTRQVNVRFEVSDVVNVAGGAPTGSITIDISNRGFSVKPDAGWIQCASDDNISGIYDFDEPNNSSTVAYFSLRTIDGNNLVTGLQRFSIGLVDYS